MQLNLHMYTRVTFILEAKDEILNYERTEEERKEHEDEGR